MAPKRRKTADDDWVPPSEHAPRSVAAAAVAAPGPDPARAWGVKVSRTTELIESDSELLVDIDYTEDCQQVHDELEAEVVVHDGTWWNAEPTKPAQGCGGDDGGSPGGGSSSSSIFDVRAFPTLAEANARAAKVWAALQAHPPPGFQLVEGAGDDECEQCRVMPDGREHYRSTLQYNMDVDDAGWRNLVESTIEVVVVPLKRSWVPDE